MLQSVMTGNNRLFVGHLADTVDEYTLVQFMSKHGKITKFDFLFHREGPKKGKPRGYAFVEYSTAEVGFVASQAPMMNVLIDCWPYYRYSATKRSGSYGNNDRIARQAPTGSQGHDQVG